MKTNPSPEKRFTKSPNGCWIWKGYTSPGGYGRLWIGGRYQQAHRVMWMLTYGSIPKGYGVLHKCDTPACVNPNHLFLGTSPENNADRDAKGRTARGSQNGRAKLTEKDVCTIRRLRQQGHTTVSLGEEYGVLPAQISKIAKGQRWNKERAPADGSNKRRIRKTRKKRTTT